jgi:hypothetical protein
MRRSSWLFLLLMALTGFSSGCHVNDKSEVSLDDCDGELLHARDSTTLEIGDPTHEKWTTTSPKAAGSCTTLYQVWYRWVSDVRAAESSPPPVAFTFSPTRSSITVEKFSGRPPGFGASSDKGWWIISFSPSPTSESGNTTTFTIKAILDPFVTEDVKVYTDILYRHSPN